MCFLLVLSPNLFGSYQDSFNVSLLDRPSCNNAFLNNDESELTLPDLHGNALKFLSALIATGVLNMDQDSYKKFCDYYYKKTTSINKQDLINLKRLISNITLTKKSRKPFIRLIGDEFCDRGSNDYYTLLLIVRMIELGIKCEFIISNHGFEFIEGYENRDFSPVGLKGEFARSLIALKFFISKQLVQKKEIEGLIERYYKPNLKIVSYSLSKDSKSIIIYSHAPTGLGDIEKLANEFGIKYKDESTIDLARTIDEINDVFQKKYVKENKVHSIFDALEKFLWNRDYTNLNRPSNHNNYQVKFVHGHDSGEETANNIYNLDFDNYLGKTTHDLDGIHQIFVFKNDSQN